MQPAIVVMSKVPKPGYTKTRLMTRMSGDECAIFHLACLMDISRVIGTTGVPGYLYYTGGSTDYFRVEHISAKDLDVFKSDGENYDCLKMYPQQGKDLGERLLHAAREVLAAHNRVIFLGTDLPDITTALLCNALQALDLYDVVIGPARDGGYYLLGIKEVHPRLFANIPWGTSEVLNKTMEAARTNNLAVKLLDSKTDIDTWDDLVSFYRAGLADEQRGMKRLNAYQVVKRMVEKYGE